MKRVYLTLDEAEAIRAQLHPVFDTAPGVNALFISRPYVEMTEYYIRHADRAEWYRRHPPREIEDTL